MSGTSAPKHATAWLPLLHEIADRADGIALRLFRDAGLRVESKADDSPVSEADRAIEAMAREVIATRAPGTGILGEEGSETPSGDGTRLIIDPIDGTRNFVRGVPVFATLLAIEQDDVVVAGVVSAPALRARWHAARDAGAFAGTRRIRVSTVSDLSRAHVFHGDLSGRTEGPRPTRLAELFAAAERTRGFGDFYQHMLVAEGAGEAAIDPKMQPWDIAAVKIVVEEAGGRSTSFAGEPTIRGGDLVSTNGVLHARVLEFLDTRPRSR